MMKRRKNLLFWTMLFFLATPFFLASAAHAVYLPDGATQDATSGGWDLPQDQGACVTGIKADGTLIFDLTKKSAPDCLTHIWPAYTNQATCGSTSNTEGAAHFWATTCIANDGTPISLKNLDRTAAMCNQAAIAAGKTSGTWATACTSSWQFGGTDANYVNGAYANDGSGFDHGFCYAKVDVTAQFGTQAACVGYNSISTPNLNNWSSSKCSYNFGVNGGLAYGNITAIDGTTTVAAGGTLPDLTGLNMGQCLLAGYTWNNYYMESGTTAMGGGTVATIASGGNVNCLRCHVSVSQYTHNALHWKESYLEQGHKNMLRKVTSGLQWGGPDADGNIALYTGWSGTGAGDGTFDWTSNPPTATKPGTSGWTYPLLYIFGDWLEPAPGALDVIVNANGHALYNGSGAYTCSACHTTGFSNQTPAFCNGDLTQTTKSACDAAFPYTAPNGRSKWTENGVCSLSSYVNSADCAAAGATWYPSTGLEASLYPTGGPEPNATYPGLNWGTATLAFVPAWDQNSIECSRCHMATLPEVYDSTNSAASGNGHDYGTAISSGAAITNLCFGCHQATAKTNNGTGLDVDLDNPATPGLNSTGTGFTGHPIGEWFLNSPHARYEGNMAPNKVGKYDIGTFANNSFTPSGTFNTQFNDGSCSVSTLLVNGQIQEVHTLADCTKAGGTWSYRTDQGTCTSCHDVHNSLFVASESANAMKKECTDCHSDDSTMNKTQAPIIDLSLISHPTGPGTPFDPTDVGAGKSPCEVCHMPDDPGTGYAMHLWRINPSASYSTFPTASQFSAGQKLPLTSPESYVGATGTQTYTNAVWVDLDLACGQCHGGSAGATATHNGAPFLSKQQLSQVAPTIHGQSVPTCEVTGSVLQSAGGDGISGVTVVLKNPKEIGKKLTTTTDSNGQYVFPPVEAAKYKFIATKAGYVFPGPQKMSFSSCTGIDTVTGNRTVTGPTITRTSYIIWAYSNKPNTKVVITKGATIIKKVTSASVVCTSAANPGPACTESNPYVVKFKNIKGTWNVKAKKTGFECPVTSPVTLPNGTAGDAVETINCTKQ